VVGEKVGSPWVNVRKLRAGLVDWQWWNLGPADPSSNRWNLEQQGRLLAVKGPVFCGTQKRQGINVRKSEPHAARKPPSGPLEFGTALLLAQKLRLHRPLLLVGLGAVQHAFSFSSTPTTALSIFEPTFP
jgi:hypothetical protein